MVERQSREKKVECQRKSIVEKEQKERKAWCPIFRLRALGEDCHACILVNSARRANLIPLLFLKDPKIGTTVVFTLGGQLCAPSPGDERGATHSRLDHQGTGF